LIVGAGPVGAISARELADRGLKVKIIEKRKHIAGNCYDEIDSYGVLIHKYGPHYFRTDSEPLLKYLSRFTDWIDGQYIVKSQVNKKLYPFPINLTTLELVFATHLDAASAEDRLNKERLPFPNPKNSEEFVLSRVGRRIYEMFYLGYTLKQWDLHPKDLDPSVCGRIPIRLNRFDRYVDQKYQVLPKFGYTQMYKNILTHPNIDLYLNTDYKDIRDQEKPKYATIYCGPIDAYFNYSLGHLPWRSLEFEFKSYENATIQDCVQINYPELNIPYTRSVEIKHATGQTVPNTTISYEYPRAVGDPYYPIPNPNAKKLYLKYKELADLEQKNTKVYFSGRLAEYTYINMDQAIEKGLETAKMILERLK
jgi:UDP-galactopyranose mutase